MKVYISGDMEGVAGITSVEQTNPAGEPEYAYSCRLMTGEVAAACEGAIAAGALDILVNDSHWNMRNIIHEDLPADVRLIRGTGKPLSMNQGLDSSFSAAAFIGYHGPAGTQDAVIDHTYSGETLFDVRINGDQCSEGRLNAALAGSFGVPIVFVSGDDKACADARRFLPGVGTATVKQAIGRYAAASLSPRRARALIREGIERALRELDRNVHKPFAFERPIRLELTFTSTAKADMASLFPGTRRTDGRTLRFENDEFLTVFRAFRALTALGAGA
ncbi:MAG: M55 family metallopeptidase [Candidatus Eremiobacteraeota bacterium]|nr:M55 family metallopeptidase [Candidatus Eremiobacteraeota bacterium]